MKIIISIILLFAVSFFAFFMLGKKSSTLSTKDTSHEQHTATINEPVQIPETDLVADTNLASSGYYEDYDQEKISRAKNGKVVLFFNADWCPTCISADRSFRKNASRIPRNVSVLKINYDTAYELKERYAITYQHTFVQVDSLGNEITRWSGGALDSLLANIQ